MSSMPDELDVKVTTVRVGRFAATVTVWGEVDLYAAPDLGEALASLPNEVRHVLVDLSQVGFIDSVGLATLVGAARRLEERHGRMLLVIDDARIKRLLAVTGLDRFFSVRSSDADTARELVGASALESLGPGD
jgi:anti-sigma B factor antagonist